MAVIEEHLVDRFRLFHLVSSLEVDLRSILRAWVLPFTEERDVYGGLYGKLVERRRLDGRSEDTANLVDYLDFSDSFQLINRFAGMIPPEVAKAMRDFTPRLEPLVQPRNRVMHTRPLEVGDVETVLGVCQEFLRTSLDLPRLRDAVRHIKADPTWTPEVSQGSNSWISNNLPLPQFDETGLVGRQRENEELLRRLLKPRDRVLSVIGEGGIGKTALVVKILYDLIDHADCPYLAVLWTSLKTERLTGHGVEQLTDAAVSVLGGLDVWGSILETETELDSLPALTDALEDLPTLIVIDNLETTSAREVVAFYDELPGDVRLLLTSRVGLGQLERRMDLEPLDNRSASRLLRQYAQRRGVVRLARLEEKALSAQADRLRRNPLAIRWYVEAVEAGGDPANLLAHQEDLLRFCLETIYDGLGEAARQALSVLHAAGRRLDLADLCLLMERDPDAVRRALHELARRSLVVARLQGSDGTHETFNLASSVELYLTSVDRPAPAIAEGVAQKERALREERERTAVAVRANPLLPTAVDDLDGEKAAVAHVLAGALLKRGEDIRSRLGIVDQAQRLSPDFYEIYRVRGFLASRERSQLATESYERALTLAPSREASARVAYFFADHLGKVVRDLGQAEAMARRAHEFFRLPTTASRLGRILTYQRDWSEAERLLRYAMTDDDVRTAIIARTQLVNLTKRRVEELIAAKRLPVNAVREGLPVLDETWAYLATGRLDRVLQDNAIQLSSEILRACSQVPDLDKLAHEIAALARGLAARRADLQASDQRPYVLNFLRALRHRADSPKMVTEAIASCISAVDPSSPLVAATGHIKMFSRTKGFGFIASNTQDYFFHHLGVVEPSNHILLVEGMQVEFEPLRDDQDRARADRVAPLPVDSTSALSNRVAQIQTVQETYCLTEDRDTSVTALVHRNAFHDHRDFDRLRESDLIRVDYELAERGPRGRSGSAHLLRRVH